jgi:DNA-binding transcriptional regulator LsrR (DeoR family)
MLSEAAQRGIVEIRIRRPLPLAESLQDRLMVTFGLRDALVLDTHGMGGVTLPKVGRLAARSLDTRLGDGDVLAISWGTAVRAVAKGLDPRTPRNVEVVQLLGGAGSRDPGVDGTELARSLASSLGGQCHFLNAPLVVDDPDLAGRLLRQRSIRETLEIGAHADIGVVGIGALVPEVSSLLRAGHLTRTELAALRRAGVMGDVCGHLFTVAGELVDDEFTRRVISISVAGLQRIPRVMGVAVGEAKVAAILGAVRSRLINVLVTDDMTATAMLKETSG